MSQSEKFQNQKHHQEEIVLTKRELEDRKVLGVLQRYVEHSQEIMRNVKVIRR